MENIIKWVLLGVFILYLVVGFFIGLIRGFKRMIIHIAFSLISIVIAILLTKVITNAILGISISIHGEKMTVSGYILKLIEERIDITKFKSVADFATSIPYAVASPVVFMIIQVLVYFLLDIIYLIVARVCLGKKKEEFKTKKPNRLLGALVGTIEGFVLMFMTFAPLTSLSNTAVALLYDDPNASASVSSSAITGPDGKLPTINEFAQDKLPAYVETYLNIFNDSVICKVCSVGGFNNAVFDYMSTVRVGGEKVVFRKDLANIARAYNDFTVVYNATIVDKDYTVDTKRFHDSAEKVIDSGLFKAVVANTIKEVVVNYDEIKTEMSLNLPQLIEDVIYNMQPTFNQPNFNAYTYLKHDFMLGIDAGSDILTQGLIDEYKSLPDKKVDTLIDFLFENKASLKKDLKNLFNLNVVGDNFNLLTDKLEDYVRDAVDSEDPDEIEFNTDVEDRGEIIDDVFEAVDRVQDINVGELIQGEGTIIDRVKNITNVDQKLIGIGEAVDAIRNLSILVIPGETESDPDKYVLDNILKAYGIDILGDTVHTSATQTITLDSYTKFMTYIKPAVVKAQDRGVLDMIDGGSFDDILDSLLSGLGDDQHTLTTMVMPFHEITKQEIKTKVFDKVIEILEDTGILNFDAYEDINTYAAWESAFDGLGATLVSLNTGTIGPEDKTYVKFLLDGGDVSTLQMQDIGKIIDIVKTNAYNGGATPKGVLNDKFMETVYIMTGDKIDSTKDYSALTRIGEGDDNKYLDIKNLLNVTDVTTGYYTINYEEKFAEIDDAIELAQAMQDSVSGISLTDEPEAFMEALNGALDDYEESEILDILDNIETIVNGNPEREVVDTSGLTNEQKEAAVEAIDNEFSPAVAAKLKELFGL